MLVFGIALGNTPVAVLSILKSFQGAFWDDFAYFCYSCCETQKMRPSQMKFLVWEVLGLWFCIGFGGGLPKESLL